MSDDLPLRNPKSHSRPRGDSPKLAKPHPDPPPEAESSRDLEDKEKKLQSLLAGLWERSQDAIAERMEILEEAKSLAAAGKLDTPARLRAVGAAHKLAGVLGTFGLPKGTELAREAEEIFEREAIVGPAEVKRLGALLSDLANLIRESRTRLD
jgi:HPt (histidine-containing phosphotransfer) domain-containing protein